MGMGNVISWITGTPTKGQLKIKVHDLEMDNIKLKSDLEYYKKKNSELMVSNVELRREIDTLKKSYENTLTDYQKNIDEYNKKIESLRGIFNN